VLSPLAVTPPPPRSIGMWFDREALVPLSHYLGWAIADLKRSFLNPAAVPLLRHGHYASR
jgi:hypothetical protein